MSFNQQRILRVLAALSFLILAGLVWAAVSPVGSIEVRVTQGYNCSDGTGSCDCCGNGAGGYIQRNGGGTQFCSGGPEDNDNWLRNRCSVGWQGLRPNDRIYAYGSEDDWPLGNDRGECTTGVMAPNFSTLYNQSTFVAQTSNFTACSSWSNLEGNGDSSFGSFPYQVRPNTSNYNLFTQQTPATFGGTYRVRFISPNVGSNIRWIVNSNTTTAVNYHPTTGGAAACAPPNYNNYCQTHTSNIDNDGSEFTLNIGENSADGDHFPLIPRLDTAAAQTYRLHVWAEDKSGGNYLTPSIHSNTITVQYPSMNFAGGVYATKGCRNTTGAFVTPLVAQGSASNCDSFSGDTYSFKIKYQSVLDAVDGPTTLPETACLEIDMDNDGVADDLDTDGDGAVDPGTSCLPLSSSNMTKGNYLSGDVELNWSGELHFLPDSNGRNGDWRYRFRVRPKLAQTGTNNTIVCFPATSEGNSSGPCTASSWMGDTGDISVSGTDFRVRPPSLVWANGADYNQDPNDKIRGVAGGDPGSNAAFGNGGNDGSSDLDLAVSVIAAPNGSYPNVEPEPNPSVTYWDSNGNGVQDDWESKWWGFNKDHGGGENPCDYSPRVEIDFQKSGLGAANGEGTADFCVILKRGVDTGADRPFRERWFRQNIKIPFTDRNQPAAGDGTIYSGVPGINCPQGTDGNDANSDGDPDTVAISCPNTSQYNSPTWWDDVESGGDGIFGNGNDVYWKNYHRYRYRFIFQNTQYRDYMTGEPLYNGSNNAQYGAWGSTNQRYIQIKKNPLRIGWVGFGSNAGEDPDSSLFGGDTWGRGAGVTPNCAFGGVFSTYDEGQAQNHNAALINSNPNFTYPYDYNALQNAIGTTAGTGCAKPVSPKWKYKIWLQDIDNIPPAQITNGTAAGYLDPTDLTNSTAYVLLKMDLNDDGNYSSAQKFARDDDLREIRVMNCPSTNSNQWETGAICSSEIDEGKIRFPGVFQFQAETDGKIGYYFETRTRYYATTTSQDNAGNSYNLRQGVGCGQTVAVTGLISETTCYYNPSRGAGSLPDPTVDPNVGKEFTSGNTSVEKYFHVFNNKPFISLPKSQPSGASDPQAPGPYNVSDFDTNYHLPRADSDKSLRQSTRKSMAETVTDPMWQFRVRFIDFDGFLPAIGVKRADNTWMSYAESPTKMGYNRATLLIDLNNDGNFGVGSNGGPYNYPDTVWDDKFTNKASKNYNPNGERFAMRKVQVGPGPETGSGAPVYYADYFRSIPTIYYRNFNGDNQYQFAFFDDEPTENLVDSYDGSTYDSNGFIAKADESVVESPHKPQVLKVVNSRPFLEWCGQSDTNFSMAITEAAQFPPPDKMIYTGSNNIPVNVDLSGDKTDRDRLDQDAVHPLNVTDEPYGNFHIGSNRYWPEDWNHPDALNGHIGNVTTTTDSLFFCVRYLDYDRGEPDSNARHLLLDTKVRPGDPSNKTLGEWTNIELKELTYAVGAAPAKRDRDSHPTEGTDGGFKQSGIVYSYLLTDARPPFPKNAATFDASADKVSGEPNGIYGFLFSDDQTLDPLAGGGGVLDEAGENHVARNFLQGIGTNEDWRVKAELNAFFHIHDDSAQLALLGKRGQFEKESTDDSYRLTSMADVINLEDTALDTQAKQNIRNKRQEIDYWSRHIILGADEEGRAVVSEIQRTAAYRPPATESCAGNMAGFGTPSYRAFEDPNPPFWNPGNAECNGCANPNPVAPDFANSCSLISGQSECEGSLSRFFIPRILANKSGLCRYGLYQGNGPNFQLDDYRSPEGKLSWFTYGAAGPSTKAYSEGGFLTAGSATPWSDVALNALLGNAEFTTKSSNIAYAYGYSGTVFEFKISRKHKAPRTVAGVVVDSNLNGYYDNYARDGSSYSEFHGWVDSQDEDDLYGQPLGDVTVPHNAGSFGRRFSLHVNLVPENLPEDTLEGTVISVPYAFRFENQNGSLASLHTQHLDSKGPNYLGPTFGDDSTYSSLVMKRSARVSDQDFVVAVKYRKPPEIYPVEVNVNEDKTVTFQARWISNFRRAPGTFYVRWDNKGNGLFELDDTRNDDQPEPMVPLNSEGSPLVCRESLTKCMNRELYNKGYLDFTYTTTKPLSLNETVDIRYEYIFSECKLPSDALTANCYGKRAGLPGVFKGPKNPSFELEERDEDVVVRNNYQHPGGSDEPPKILIGRRHQNGFVSLRIYSQTGRLVYDNNGKWIRLRPRNHKILIWRLVNNSGERVGSGVYTLVMTTRKETFMKRVVVVRSR